MIVANIILFVSQFKACLSIRYVVATVLLLVKLWRNSRVARRRLSSLAGFFTSLRFLLTHALTSAWQEYLLAIKLTDHW